jgi:hypothetical protein
VSPGEYQSADGDTLAVRPFHHRQRWSEAALSGSDQHAPAGDLAADLSEDERVRIADLERQGLGVRAIAAGLDRSPATISRELRRNRDPDSGQYRPFTAQRLAVGQRARPLGYPAGQTEAWIGPLAMCSPTRSSCITDKLFQPLSLLIGHHCRGHQSSGEGDPHPSGGALTLSSDNDRGLFPIGCEGRERRPEYLVRGTHHPPPRKGVRHTDGEESDRSSRLAGIGSDRVVRAIDEDHRFLSHRT